jgi:hypothetical protein
MKAHPFEYINRFGMSKKDILFNLNNGSLHAVFEGLSVFNKKEVEYWKKKIEKLSELLGIELDTETRSRIVHGAIIRTNIKITRK